MNLSNTRGFTSQLFYGVMSILCIAHLSGNSVALGQQAEPQNTAPTQEAPKIPNDQLDSLVAPIALYPDPLLSQTLVASTYPLEIIQLQQWLGKNKNLKGKALADAVEKEKWDPSIQSMAALPDVVKQLAENVSWTTDLGNAFLAQQSDVMDAVQRMRAKAQGAGNLKSSQQQKVESKTVESKTVIVIEQADPQVVYVPTYSPTVVYGAPPAYPYPPITYPPGYGMLAFGAGVAIGAAWGNGGWGYNCGWGSNNDVTINTGNKYVNNSNKQNINRGQQGGQQGGKWGHNPEHRGSAPYGNKKTASQYGGTARGQGDTAGRQPGGGASARPGGGTGARAATRPGGGSAATRPSGGGAAARPGGGEGAGSAGARPGGGASTMPASRGGGGGGGNSIGGRSPSAGGGGSAFSGGGMGGSSMKSASNRGGHSMGGGGFSRGGGGGGGGGRRR